MECPWIEELLWHNDPPENEEEAEQVVAETSEEEDGGEADPLAPLADGGPKPTNVDPGNN